MAKPREQIPGKKITKVPGKVAANRGRGPTVTAVPLVSDWQEVIVALRSRRFESLSGAVAAVVDAILARAGSSRAEERDFLTTLFMTDTELSSILRANLTIADRDDSEDDLVK